MNTRPLGVIAGVAIASAAAAQVESYTGPQIVQELGFADFNGLKSFDPLLNYKQGGLTVSMDHFEYDQLQIDGTPMYYPGGGDTEMIIIRRTDGFPFGALEFQIWNGWNAEPSYVWAQAYLDGALQKEFNFNHPGPSKGYPVRGFKGDFDELRIAAYHDAATRNLHDPFGYQTAALDNMRYGLVEGQECHADCNGDQTLDLFDFLCFVNLFNTVDPTADCDGNGVLDLFDFLCFVNAFNQGC